MARRRQAKPKQKKQALPWRPLAGAAAIAAFAAGLGWAGYRVTDPSTLPVKTVRVGGELVHLERDRLRRTVAPFARAGLLRVDIDEVRIALEALPWVERAAVRRAWPDALEISIREQQPVAMWGRKALVNERGELFYPPADEWPRGLPELAGPDRNAAAIASRFSELRNLLAPLGIELAALIQDERRSWRLRLRNGMDIRLGRKQTAERLLRFMRLYPRVLAGRAAEIKRVDLRYTNGFAVAWRKRAEAAGV
jgi:cell division protein FtsQ